MFYFYGNSPFLFPPDNTYTLSFFVKDNEGEVHAMQLQNGVWLTSKAEGLEAMENAKRTFPKLWQLSVTLRRQGEKSSTYITSLEKMATQKASVRINPETFCNLVKGCFPNREIAVQSFATYKRKQSGEIQD